MPISLPDFAARLSSAAERYRDFRFCRIEADADVDHRTMILAASALAGRETPIALSQA